MTQKLAIGIGIVMGIGFIIAVILRLKGIV